MTTDVLSDDFKETPYWWDLAPLPPAGDERPPASADVVVVGSGYVGLSAALTLSRRGMDVVVLDAEALGHGASTRNAGYIGRNAGAKLGDMVPKFGLGFAVEVCKESAAAHDFTVKLIRDEQIACHYQDTGRFTAAPTRAVFDGMARDLDLMREHGVPVDAEMVLAADGPQGYRPGRYWGGQILRGNGVTHAGLYHRGLLERVVGQGARAYGFCPAQEIVRKGAGFRVATPKGAISAGHVVVATNGYTPKATGWLRRRVIPVDAFMIATAPLPRDLVERIAPAGRPMIENRYTPCWMRPNEDGTRILVGGAGAERPFRLPEKARQLHAIMTDIAPALAEAKISHCWTGKTGFTFDMLPHTGSHDGMEYAMGWCGSGLPLGTYLGHKTALRVLGDPESRSVFDGRPFPTMPFYTGHPWMLPLVVASRKRKDRKLLGQR